MTFKNGPLRAFIFNGFRGIVQHDDEDDDEDNNDDADGVAEDNYSTTRTATTTTTTTTTVLSASPRLSPVFAQFCRKTRHMPIRATRVLCQNKHATEQDKLTVMAPPG